MGDDKVLVVVFDGLRPDMVVPGLMPNLHRFAVGHCAFPRSRAVFPSETRVNAAAVVTGCDPARHGLIANQFHAAAAFADHPVNTSKMDHLLVADRAWNGGLMQAPTLGERLHAAGKSLAVVSTASTGATWLLNPHAERLGQLRWSAHGDAWGAPADELATIARRFGPVPPVAIPSTARIDHATSVWLDHVRPGLDPDVAILWFADPDWTYHYSGIGTPEALACLAGADRAFGRIVDAWQRSPDRDRRQIVTLSDHGHVTTLERIDLVAAFNAAGFPTDTRAADADGLALVPGSPAGLTLRRRDPGLARDVVAWLAEQSWCGLILSAGGEGDQGGIAGTLSHRLLGIAHPRSADILFTLRDDDEPGSGGWPGRCRYDYAIPLGGGMHGGLHPRELNNWLAVGGSAFHEATVSPCPAGIVDVAPTILHLLGLPAEGCDGRVLGEALVGGETPDHRSWTVETSLAGHAQRLSLSQTAGTRYIDSGTRLA